MAWAEPQYSSDKIDDAGAMLADGTATADEMEHAYAVINNWRSSHAFPLNTFQMSLRNKARQIESQSLIAQRVKRLSSIESKLRRLSWLKLSAMQDIAGCRVVLTSVGHVDRLVELYKDSYIKHELDNENDYIRKPKRSGYRGIHLMYRYYSDKKDTYNGLKVEMQFRSSLQHAWATAVETVGTFTSQSLKSSQGEKGWLEFFAMMGSAIALREQCPPVPGTPSDQGELIKALQEYAQTLEVEARLSAYGAALQTFEGPMAKDAHYFLLVLDPSAQSVTITGYKRTELERASDEYLAAERGIDNQSNADAVLVSVESIAALKRAYPNYFLDTAVFLNEVRRVVSGKGGRIRSVRLSH